MRNFLYHLRSRHGIKSNMKTKYNRIPWNFGALPPEYASRENARVEIIPVPYDGTSTYGSGARNGPAAIIAASMNMELYDEELGVDTSSIGIHTQDAIEPVATGPEGMVDRVEEAVAEVLDEGKFPVLLGGEHSISVGAMRAIAGIVPGLTILQLDAHADLRDSYGGSPYSHACAGRRAVELGALVQAGIRSLSAEEARFREESGVPSFSAADMVAGAVTPSEIAAVCGERVYITLDLDVFDPSLMPATGTPEPGGLDWHTVNAILRETCRGREVVGFDIVELSPIPYTMAPDFLAARLVYRLIGYARERELKEVRM